MGMKILYIGPYSIGATSRMRGEIIKKILSPSIFQVIDTERILNKHNFIFKSLAFRYKIGSVIKSVNVEINNKVKDNFDLIWVDKGVFIKPETTLYLKQHTKILIHYTPDPAFYYHRSKYFFNSVHYYDYCITTKSYELDFYKKANAKNILLTTQGYDPAVHKPYHRFEEKQGIVFVGHYEKSRAIILRKLLEKGFKVKLAGINWQSFVKKNKNKYDLDYFGIGIYDIEYAKLLSSSLFGAGFLSKIVPELHTTRTFEIPACKTILLTERNYETNKFFKDDEVIFYENPEELTHKISILIKNKEALKNLSNKGYKAVVNGGFNYETIIRKLLYKIGVIWKRLL